MRVALSVDGSTLVLNLRVNYNETAKYWIMAVSDASNNLLIDSLALVTGFYPAANLLPPSLGIGSAQVLNVSGTSQDYPDATNLGSDFLLVWDDTAAAV
jgi:hypothetical protein